MISDCSVAVNLENKNLADANVCLKPETIAVIVKKIDPEVDIK